MADLELLKMLVTKRHEVFTNVLAVARANQCRVAFRRLQYRPLNQRRHPFDDFLYLDGGWSDPAETTVPDLHSVESFSLGIFMEMQPMIERGAWPPEVPEMAFGFAVGAAQNFAVLNLSAMSGDIRPELEKQSGGDCAEAVALIHGSLAALSNVFFRLAQLEHQAWKNLRPQNWKSSKGFQERVVLLKTCRMLENIMRCCVLAPTEPGRFAFHLSEVYESAFLPKLQQMAKQRTGKHLLPEAEFVIQWMREYRCRQAEKPKQAAAEAALIENQIIRFKRKKSGQEATTRDKFWVRLTGGKWSKKGRSRSTLDDWWKKSRE